jgi:hypothetical protein
MKWLVERYNVLGLRALRTLRNAELDTLAFFKVAVAFTYNGTVVDKNVTTGILLDKAKPFGTIEPLHGACLSIRHDLELLSQICWVLLGFQIKANFLYLFFRTAGKL